ncbi:MAG: hypothetical protein EOP70_12685 [Variovorax sp.]|nr:MAG: hypothetical protein EOP70_12685 [Variovorax sp.]
MNTDERSIPRVLGALTLAATFLLAGCASDPSHLPTGATRAQTLQQLGTPTAVYPLPGGGERLQYSRAPMGTEVSNVDLDAAGRVVSNRQEMQEYLFDRTIDAATWRQDDVLRTYGRPYEITRVTSYDGVVWTWRYKTLNSPRYLYIYIDRAGKVTRYHTGPDLTRDMMLDR